MARHVATSAVALATLTEERKEDKKKKIQEKEHDRREHDDGHESLMFCKINDRRRQGMRTG